MTTSTGVTVRPSFLDRQGVARPIAWGYLAIALFMTGDGMEAGFLAPFMTGLGINTGFIALLFAFYGLTAAVASWFSGGLSEAWGPKAVMMLGFCLWLALHVVFLVALSSNLWTLAFVAYGLRGFAYPLFAYGFFTWIVLVTPSTSMTRAAGWYWFFYLFGFGVAGGYVGAWVIPAVGQLGSLWLEAGFILAGGLLVLILVRALQPAQRPTVSSSVRSVLAGATILKTHPKVGIGGVIRLINAFSIFVFIALLGIYMTQTIGLPIEQWQAIWGTAFLANVLGNVLMGYIASSIGELRVVRWLGAVGCILTCLALFYVPLAIGANFWAILTMAVLWGLSVTGFVPVSAIVPRLAPERMAAAVSVLSLAAALSQMVASLIAALAEPFGLETVIWVLVATYALAFALTYVLRGIQSTPPGATQVSSTVAIR
ncbi:RbtT/DalT/CsbX family MFS transporter [Arthrobacter sp. NPDC080031]|uniref:RbtT/DalT/CsbX family MFS transporter n=1 Tax=Arthrobacter sp. NPDC080031 TaxID=3155918 RepID=UPI00344F13CE